MKRILLLALFLCGNVALAQDRFTPPKFPVPQFDSAKSFNVKDFGATGDGKTNDTQAINKAIEAASAAKPGIVKFPEGKYLVASVHLKSNVQLSLDDAAVIVGAKEGYDEREPNEFKKYQDTGHSHFHDSVMWGEDLENFSIIGGKVNGGGTTQGDKYPEGVNGGNKVVAIKRGKNLLFKNVIHENGGHFVYLLNDCENITVEKVVIKKSRDAIDLMGCRNVAVFGCNFTGCSDDTLGIKSDYALGRKINTENIYAWDNYFESGCNGLQFGSETAGDFRNINIWNITINQSFKAGIGITSNDGGIIEDVHYKDITIKGAANPIFMIITDRLRTGEKNAKLGKIRNVTIENVTASEVVAGRHHGPANCATISGLPDSHIENITLKNVKITYKGGENAKDADRVPPYPKDYSPNEMGVRPAAGFYARHVKGLHLDNVEIAFEKENPKPRLVFSDIDGLKFDSVKVQTQSGVQTMRLDKVQNIEVRNSPELEKKD